MVQQQGRETKDAASKPDMLSVKPIDKVQSDNTELVDLEEILKPGTHEAKITKQDVPGMDAFILKNVLSTHQCEELQRRSEAAGYTFWNANAKQDFRSAYTVEVHSKELADHIWQQIKDFVVSPVVITSDEERCQRDIEGEWIAYGVNESLVLARYRDGGHFSPHTDGYTIVDFNHRSLYSLLLYLNDCESGGATRLFSPQDCSQTFRVDEGGRFRWSEESVIFSCPADMGTSLAFFQDIPHEGEPVYDSAEKYIIRTDIMYYRKNPICSAPHDVEAYKLIREAEILEADGKADEAARMFRRATKMSPDLAKVFGF